MARHRAAIREDHRPRDSARPPIKLAIDEIGDTAKEQTDRDRLGDDVRKGKQRYSTGMGKQDDCNGHTERAAVEGHPAVPYVKRLDRMIDVVSRLVEENVYGTDAKVDAACRPLQESDDIMTPDHSARTTGNPLAHA